MQHDFPPIVFMILIVWPTAHTEQKGVEGRKEGRKDIESGKKEKNTG